MIVALLVAGSRVMTTECSVYLKNINMIEVLANNSLPPLTFGGQSIYGVNACPVDQGSVIRSKQLSLESWQ